MARKLWILFALLVGAATYGAALATPLAGVGVESIKGAAFWSTFLEQDPPGLGRATAYATPVHGYYYVVASPSCGLGWGSLYRASAEEVEGAWPGALAALAKDRPTDSDMLFMARLQDRWRGAILDQCREGMPAREVTRLALMARAKVVKELDPQTLPSYTDPESLLARVKDQERLSPWMLDRIEGRRGRLVREGLLWCLLCLWLLGVEPPSRVRPLAAAVRAGLWPLVVIGVGSVLISGLWRGGFHTVFPMTPGETLGRFFYPKAIVVLVACGGCAVVAALVSAGWRRPRPQRLFWAATEAAVLATPIAFTLYAFAWLLELEEAAQELGIKPLVSWTLSLGGTLWLAAGLGVFALRGRAPERPEENEGTWGLIS